MLVPLWDSGVDCNKFQAQVPPSREPIFEGRDGVAAVAVLVAMIAIMQAEDVAGGGAGDVAPAAGLRGGALGDGLHARNEPFGGASAPVARDERPHHALQAEAVGGREHPRVAQTKGRTEPTGRGADGFGDGIVAALEFFADVRGRTQEEIRVSFGVIADAVTTRDGLLQKIWNLADEPADDEKGGAGVVFVEEIEKPGSNGRIGAVVESEGEFFRAGGTVNVRAE